MCTCTERDADSGNNIVNTALHIGLADSQMSISELSRLAG